MNSVTWARLTPITKKDNAVSGGPVEVMARNLVKVVVEAVTVNEEVVASAAAVKRAARVAHEPNVSLNVPWPSTPTKMACSAKKS